MGLEGVVAVKMSVDVGEKMLSPSVGDVPGVKAVFFTSGFRLKSVVVG